MITSSKPVAATGMIESIVRRDLRVLLFLFISYSSTMQIMTNQNTYVHY